MIITEIQYFGVPAITICDGLCEKAWGLHSRPRHILDENDADNFEYLSDIELSYAPDDPETYEGGDKKPYHPEKHNKWCVRECERCVLMEVGLHNWNKRVSNHG